MQLKFLAKNTNQNQLPEIKKYAHATENLNKVRFRIK